MTVSADHGRTGGQITGPVLVTGAAGFIGSHVAEHLLNAGVDVVGIDNFDPMYDVGLKRANIRDVQRTAPAGGARFHFHECDLNDTARLSGVVDATRPRGVIHLAAKAGVRPSILDPVGYCTANVTATAALLGHAQRLGCDRFVMASSSSVYGNSPSVPFSESHDVSMPISPYAATKKACELIGHTHWHLTRMPVACLRFFTVYGPRQRPDLAIQMFMMRIARGEQIPVFGEGTSRDYTYIDDIVHGVIAAYRRIPELGFRVWNLGSDHPVGLDEMIDTIARTVGRPADIVRKPMQPGDVMRTWADLSLVRADLGYRPSTDFASGVARQWEWNVGRQATA